MSVALLLLAPILADSDSDDPSTWRTLKRWYDIGSDTKDFDRGMGGVATRNAARNASKNQSFWRTAWAWAKGIGIALAAFFAATFKCSLNEKPSGSSSETPKGTG